MKYYLTEAGAKFLDRTDSPERQEKVDEILQLAAPIGSGLARAGALAGRAGMAAGRSVGRAGMAAGRSVGRGLAKSARFAGNVAMEPFRRRVEDRVRASKRREAQLAQQSAERAENPFGQ